jgi:hypothetical protein
MQLTCWCPIINYGFIRESRYLLDMVRGTQGVHRCWWCSCLKSLRLKNWRDDSVTPVLDTRIILAYNRQIVIPTSLSMAQLQNHGFSSTNISTSVRLKVGLFAEKKLFNIKLTPSENVDGKDWHRFADKFGGSQAIHYEVRACSAGCRVKILAVNKTQRQLHIALYIDPQRYDVFRHRSCAPGGRHRPGSSLKHRNRTWRNLTR